MRKRAFTLFLVAVAVFALALPIWALSKDGAADSSPEKVSSSDDNAKELFATNCGTCHTLERAGTDGIVGPNLDELLGNPPDSSEERVLSAVENGLGGRMPAGILQGQQAEIVADFVSRVAGQ